MTQASCPIFPVMHPDLEVFSFLFTCSPRHSCPETPLKKCKLMHASASLTFGEIPRVLFGFPLFADSVCSYGRFGHGGVRFEAGGKLQSLHVVVRWAVRNISLLSQQENLFPHAMPMVYVRSSKL